MSFLSLGSINFEHPSILLFVITIAVCWISLVYYFIRKKGWLPTFRYFAPIMIAAVFFEAAAVANGRYFYSGFFVYINVFEAQVPCIILFGWAVNLILFLWMSKTIVFFLYSKTNYLQMIFISILTGIFGILLDFFEDPLAHTNHWWTWTETTTLPTIYTVPLTNYLDWFLILFCFSLALQLIDATRLGEWRKTIISILTIPLLGTIIYVLHTLLTIGV